MTSKLNSIDSVKSEISSFLRIEKLALLEASVMSDTSSETPKKMPWNTSEMESSSTVKRPLSKRLHQEVTLEIITVETIEVVDSEIEDSMIEVATDSITIVVVGEMIAIDLMIGEEVIDLMIDEVETGLMIDEIALMIDEEEVLRRP